MPAGGTRAEGNVHVLFEVSVAACSYNYSVIAMPLLFVCVFLECYKNVIIYFFLNIRFETL